MDSNFKVTIFVKQLKIDTMKTKKINIGDQVRIATTENQYNGKAAVVVDKLKNTCIVKLLSNGQEVEEILNVNQLELLPQ